MEVQVLLKGKEHVYGRYGSNAQFLIHDYIILMYEIMLSLLSQLQDVKET